MAPNNTGKRQQSKTPSATRRGQAAGAGNNSSADRRVGVAADHHVHQRASRAAGKGRSRGAGSQSMEQRQSSYPQPPLPKLHQESPGLESEVTPRPKFEAPAYRPAGKLEGKVALVTGGDSGIDKRFR